MSRNRAARPATAKEFLQKKRKGLNERLWEILQDSTMSLKIEHDVLGFPVAMDIHLRGQIARIPSLKNSKLPGLNIPNVEVMAKVKALDAMFLDQRNGKGSWEFGETPLYLLLVVGHRPNRFDPDNCLCTIRDWLEPQNKPVGKGKLRLWGCGVTADDFFVSGCVVRAVDVGLETEDSFIFIRREVVVREHVRAFVGAIIGKEKAESRETWA